MFPTIDIFAQLFNTLFAIPLAGQRTALAGTGTPFADFRVLPIESPSIVALGSRGGSLEAVMARKRQESRTRNGKLIGMIWFIGVALFVLELNAGLDYVQARLANLAPNCLGFLPAIGVATWKIVGSAFWNYSELVRTFQIVPLITLPFLLVGLALWLRYKMVFQEHNVGNDEQN
ncbi:MAG TPA: hypothetical protein VGH37_13200 [Candidatus Acidoferrum sp.]|jgi:hypothetical protein